MKIGIMSDTHDNSPAFVWAIEYLNEKQIKYALHAGDMINPGFLYRVREHYQGEFHFVFGNNDGEKALLERRANLAENITCHLEEMRLEIEGRKIFMNHYSSIGEVVAKSGEFDVVIGGHDHLYRVNKYGACVFVNPGNMVTKDKWLPQDPDKESSMVIMDLEIMETERIMLPKAFQL